ncbi:MAG: regulatory signaling modulator protein AmpE [Gammaproteobacteria bacterium]|nr:regulatory signaling modulator protein AmpE [Gammaproteobacteria bacterium]
MKFIVLLFSVLLQRQTKQSGYQRSNGWYLRLLKPFDLAQMSLRGQVVAFTLLVVLPSVAIGVGINQLSGVLGSVLSIIIQVVLFLYILGRDDFSSRFNDYKTCWARQDYQGAYHCAQQFLSMEEQAQSQTPLQLHKKVQEAIVSAWFRRFFAFAFWYLAAGIGGALFCLLTIWFFGVAQSLWLKSLLHGLAWAPARLLAVSIALAGDFVQSFSTASKFMLDFESDSQTVLYATMFKHDQRTDESFDCTQAVAELEAGNQLMQRCAVIWLLVVASLTVFAGI